MLRRSPLRAAAVALIVQVAVTGCGDDSVATTTEGGTQGGTGATGATGGTAGTGGTGGGECGGGKGGDGTAPLNLTFGSNGNDSADQVVIDSAHRIIMSGKFGGDIDFGGVVLSPGADGLDAFLLSLEADGQLRFALPLFVEGGAGLIQGLAIGPCDDIFASGNSYGSVKLGDQVLPSNNGGSTAFAARLTSAGEVVWARAFGGEGDTFVTDVAVDAAGNMAIVGKMGGTLDFGSGQTLTSNNADGFAAVLGPQGDYVWGRVFGGPGSADGAQGIGIDAKGNVVVLGHFWGDADFGGGTVTSTGEKDLFVARYDAAGTHLGQAQFPWEGTGYLDNARLEVDAEGNSAIAGQFGASVQFGAQALAGTGGLNDVFLARLDSSLAPLWSQAFGVANSEEHRTGMALGPEGEIAFTGFATSKVSFGGGVLPFTSVSFFAIFSPAGDHLASDHVGYSMNIVDDGVFAEGIALDAGGSVVAAGGFQGAPDFGEGPVTSKGSTDVFVTRMHIVF